MNPIKFPGANMNFTTNQPDNKPLPLLKTSDGMCITCWELTNEEIEEISKTRNIYISQLTFNRGFNPIRPASNLADGLNV
jgi:hypothetical protein